MNREPFRIEPYIDAAKRVSGGHLHVGRGGYTLHQGRSQLSGYDCEAVKAACIAAGLPVIDSRSVPFEAVAKLVVSGPMVAVDREPDPAPWHAYSYAPLGIVAAAYRKAGAEIFNIPAADPDHRAFCVQPEGPLKTLIAGWEDHVAQQRTLKGSPMSDTRHIPPPNGRTAAHQIGTETPGRWRRVSTHQVTHDGSVLLTFGVQVSDTQQWVGKAHAVGPTIDDKAECFANAGLFAASKDMAVLLMEAAQLWAEEFENDTEISGADLVAWFAEWRQRVKPILALAVTP